MKLKGFAAVFTYVYPSRGEIVWEISSPANTFQEAEKAAHNMYDDKWNFKCRHKCRFYILDLGKMKYTKYKRQWKTPFNYKKWRKTGEAGE